MLCSRAGMLPGQQTPWQQSQRTHPNLCGISTVVSPLGKLTNLYKVGSIIYMDAKIQENRKKKKRKKKPNLLGEARAFKGTTKMPTIFKPPFLKKRFFFGLKYFTLNVNGRMSLIHRGHLCNVNPCPPFLNMVNFNLAIITTNVIV